MSAPHAKRKVMGRIDLSNSSEGAHSPRNVQPTARVNASSPAPSLATVRKAKVNLSSITPSSNVGISGPAPRAHVSTASSSSPVVRSPLNGPSGFNPLSSPPGERSAASSSIFAARGASASSSRVATRSPSPSRLQAAPRGGQAQDYQRPHSPSLAPQRPRARPASMLHSNDGSFTSVSSRAAPEATAKAAPSLDVLPRRHIRAQSSVASGFTKPFNAVPYQARSRSPSPTLVKVYAQEGRRISHGSTASLGGGSAPSAYQPNSTGRTSGQGPTRPSLPSLAHYSGTSYSASEKSTPGLESPVHLSSPPGGEGSSSVNGLFTSPTGNVPLASPNILLSPTAEADTEALEAKTNRKILDLEITNKSLLAINSGLEVVKLKQAREIRDLKRRVRDGRGLGDRLGLQADVSEDLSGSDLEDEEEASDEEAPLNADLEEAHQRCKTLIDAMVAQARHAILSRYEPEQRTMGNRVLHPAELDAMRGGEAEAEDTGTTAGLHGEESEEEIGGLVDQSADTSVAEESGP